MRSSTSPAQRRDKVIAGKQSSAFITARKGFCYLTIRYGGRNFNTMRIRQYTLDADEKRHMRPQGPHPSPPISFSLKWLTARPVV